MDFIAVCGRGWGEKESYIYIIFSLNRTKKCMKYVYARHFSSKEKTVEL